MADPHPGSLQCFQVARPEGEADQQRQQHQLRPEAAAGVRGEQHGHDRQVSGRGDDRVYALNECLSGEDLAQEQEGPRASTNSPSDTGS